VRTRNNFPKWHFDLKRVATIRITNPSLRWNKIAQKCFPCRQTRLFTLRGWDSVRYRQARYSGGRVGHGRGTVRVTNNFVVFELNSTHAGTMNIDRIICAVQKPLVLMLIGPLIPYQLRSDFRLPKSANFFLYASPSMS
jgi:hypothetical protein